MEPDIFPQYAGQPAPQNIVPQAPPAPPQFQPPQFQPQQPTQPQYVQPPVTPQAPPAPVSIAPEELARLYTVQKQYEEAQRVQAEQARQVEAARLMAEAEKGKVQEAFQAFQRQAQTETESLRNTLKQGEVGRVVAEALTGIQFVSDEARKDAMLILRSQVDAAIDPATGQVVVRDLSGRPAMEALREMATSPRFAHYRAPSTQGGTAGQGFQARPAIPNAVAYQQGSHADIVNQVRAARGLPPLDPAAMGSPAPTPTSYAQPTAQTNGMVWRSR